MHQVKKETLPARAREVIDQYLALPIGSKPSCPYFNNKRQKTRSSLAVLIGKGTPQEIVEECEIQAIQSRIHIPSLTADALKEFLVEKNIGVDCSGFAYHILDALSLETTGSRIRSHLSIKRKGFLGSLIVRFRPVENVNVRVLADDANSSVIPVKDAKPGDIIVFMGTGPEKTYDHVLVITAVEHTGAETIIHYAHSYARPADGLYNHGVREGTITMTSFALDLLKGSWLEQGKTAADNYTLESALNAYSVSLRRMKFLA